MSQSMHTRVNNFTIRSFRETADKDYITARMAYRARLIQPFLWSALHCLEKYVKCILVINRIRTNDLRHSVLKGLKLMEKNGKFELAISTATLEFIRKLEEDGADDRYYLLSYDVESFEIARLDLAVWELRRYCQPLAHDPVELNDSAASLLGQTLDRVHRAKKMREKGTCITGGALEKIIGHKEHPARSALIWNNLYFGPSRRKTVKMRDFFEYGNSPFFLDPEILDEVIKYVFIPQDIQDGVREFAKEDAAKKVKAERAVKKAANA